MRVMREDLEEISLAWHATEYQFAFGAVLGRIVFPRMSRSTLSLPESRPNSPTYLLDYSISICRIFGILLSLLLLIQGHLHMWSSRRCYQISLRFTVLFIFSSLIKSSNAKMREISEDFQQLTAASGYSTRLSLNVRSGAEFRSLVGGIRRLCASFWCSNRWFRVVQPRVESWLMIIDLLCNNHGWSIALWRLVYDEEGFRGGESSSISPL